MAKVTAADVKELRTATGSGMMDCKKALVEADGDFDKAIEVLRKKGQKVAAKRADRESSEGAVIAKVNGDASKGVIVSLNCETDFVAKNDDFKTLAHGLAEKALDYSSKDEFLKADYEGLSVEEKLTEQTGVIGEKIEIGAFKAIESAFVGSYIHAGNKIASIVGLSDKKDKAADVAKNISMQVAAMNPLALNEDKLDKETVDKELELAKEQMRKEGKPEDMLDKIAQGKLKRFYKDNTLVNQNFIQDDKKSVKQYVQDELGDDVTVTSFERAELG